MKTTFLFKIYYSANDFYYAIKDQKILPKYVKKISYVKVSNIAEYPEVFITCWDNNNNNLIGCLKQICIPQYSYNEYYNNCSYLRTIMYITILDMYKNCGIGTELLKQYFNFYKLNNLSDTINLSPFSQEGYKFIRHKIFSIANDFNIKIKDAYCYEK